MGMNDQKKRLYRFLQETGIVLAIGIAYALFVRLTGWGIPCIFHLVTGLLCPGCGISRMFLALLKLDFALAARYNLLVLCMLPVGLVLYGYKNAYYIKTGERKTSKVETVLYCIAIVSCAAFFLLRNFADIPFLALP